MVQKVVCLPNLPLAKSLYDFKMPFLSCSFETESYSFNTSESFFRSLRRLFYRFTLKSGRGGCGTFHVKCIYYLLFSNVIISSNFSYTDLGLMPQ